MAYMGCDGSISRRAFLAGAAALGLAACSGVGRGAGELHQRSFFCFDTVCAVGSWPDGVGVDEAIASCERYEGLFSRTVASSDVGRVNQAAGAPVAVDFETAALVAASLRYSELSGGVFDITIGAVSELWDFHEGVVPDPADVAEALAHVGWRAVEVDEAAATLRLADPAARIDLGGIAKGYVADRVIAGLAAAGATSGFVNLGGNVAVFGGKPDGGDWVVGVRDPFGEDGADLVARASVAAGSVVTSGLYERSFERDGHRYWHILDPRTGYPVATSVASASVLARRSIDGDGLTKPLFFMTPDEGLAFIRAQGADALVVTDAGAVCLSDDSPFELL